MSDQKYSRPYLDFYQRYNIAPVAQDVSNLQKHFDRREALFRHLGIIPSSIKDREIIEFGPGTGHNSIFTNSLAPHRYVLVDANPTSIHELHKLFSEYYPDHRNQEIVNCDIMSFNSEERFDFVFCEGVISFQHDTVNFLKHVAKFTKPGGCLVITCIDNISYISELLRRAIGSLLVDPQQDLETRLAILVKYFEPHLKTLKDMSRPPRDWVLDSILQPFIGEMLTIKDAIQTLEVEFDVYGSSPHMLTDWRWYKSIHTDRKSYNELALETYLSNIHNFMDYRLVTQPRSSVANQALVDLCHRITSNIFKLELNTTPQSFEELLELVDQLNEMVRPYASLTAEALEDYVSNGKSYLKTGTFPQPGAFQPFFGRGQQYLSLIRR